MRTPVPAFAVAAALALASAGAADPPARRSATLVRDAYGVPHVFAATDEGVVFGMAWALAEDDWPLIEENYTRALGRIAERDGEKGVEADWLARALEIPGVSLDEYSRATPRMRGLLEAYAAGLNAYLSAHPDRKPAFGRVEPWFPLALIRYKYYELEFLRYAGLQPRWTTRLMEKGWPAPAVKPPPGSIGDGAPEPPFEESPFGSNAWALAPSRTASGHAMLLVNPHQQFEGVQRYGEIHLHSAEGLRFSGLTVFGFLLPYMGNNERLGWACTDNYADIGDLYAEAFEDPERPLAYRYGATTREAATWTETIRVREGDRLAPRTYRFWKTHHGPVVGVDDENRPLSVRLARYDEGGWYDQWDAMIRARTLAEWKAALARRNVAYMNTMYADADGNIAYVYFSAVPRRDPAFDYSGLLDGSDPRVEWQGFHPLEDLPQVLNPKAGYLLNTNSSPFTVTREADVPYARGQFPRYMVGPETDNPRAVSSRRVLESMTRVLFDDFAREVWDTRLSAADEMIPAVTEEWRRLGQARAAELPAPLRRARGRADLARVLERLNRWDRRADVASVETTWLSLVNERRILAARAGAEAPWPWSRALVEAVDLLRKRWGRIDVAWGDVSRLQRRLSGAPEGLDPGRPSLPVGGAASSLGSVFAFHSVPMGDPGPRLGAHGNSFVKVIEFGPTVRARSVLNFGQGGDPASPHFFDQAPLYAKRAFKEAWFEEAEVRAHAVRTYVVQEPAAPAAGAGGR